MPTDLHQHLWPAPFVAALRARREPPRLDGWTLLLAGEPPLVFDPATHDPAARAALAADDGADLVCVSPAASLGIDRLPAADADALADAWLEGALALPAPFAAWTPARTPAALEDALAAGAIGLELAGRPARRARGARRPRAPARDARGRGPAAVRASRTRRRHDRAAGLVGAGRALRRAAARRVVGVGRRRAGVLPRACRSASRPSRASARCTASAIGRAAATARRSTRSRSWRHRPTAPRPSTPSSARWASTSSATGRTARTRHRASRH